MKKIVYEESKVDIQFCCIHKSKMMKTSGTKLKKKSKQKNNKIGEVVAKMVDKAKSSLISSHRHTKIATIKVAHMVKNLPSMQKTQSLS